jgi:phosphate transport system substrate-binding protein
MNLFKWAQCSIASALLCTPLFAKEIIIAGTGNALGTMSIMAEEYQKLTPETKVIVLPSIGSSGAIKAVPAGKVDIGLSSRPFKSTEFTNGAIAVEYARSPTVIAVSNKLSVSAITVEDLVSIYTGKLTHWPTGELIRPILRQADDDNTVQLKQLSSDLKKALQDAEKETNFLFATNDQETVSKVEKIPGSFAVTALSLIMSEKRDIHALSLDGIEPTVENGLANKYPMVKHFYFILPKDIPEHVSDFLSFAASPKGKAIFEKYGNYVPQ